MPTPLKPCDGSFRDELQEILLKNKDRAQWAAHPCQVCGQSYEPTLVKGRWVPVSHWPSVSYRPRQAAKGKKQAAAPVDAISVNASEATGQPV